MKPTEAMKRACEIVGSKSALAKLLSVRAPTISQWCSGSRPVPPERALQIEKVCKGCVLRSDLCPDFPWEAAAV
ncbi:Cro/CI family transcriptional regulator [Pseudomonas sp. UBA7530]|uniref:transcriptional regulator n=1 Tax=Pseudomonas sp. UBA7530 TaxID=1947341 RepID=UPI0026013A93|nr:Cro/CI family transcriptional regulator [Pseudomonas sp. UBA7530]